MTGHWLMCLLALDAVLATNKKLGGWYKAEISKEICLDVFFHDREGTVQEEVICGQAGTVVSEEMMLKGKNPYTVAASDKPKLRHFLDDVKKICNIIFDPTKDGVFQYEEQQDIVLYKNGSRDDEFITMKPGTCEQVVQAISSQRWYDRDVFA